jgi:hypothetical protein
MGPSYHNSSLFYEHSAVSISEILAQCRERFKERRN